MSAQSLRVVIADDQALVRAGCRMILDAQGDIDVVGKARDGLKAIAAWRRLRPNIILMDIRMPEMDGLDAPRRIMDAGGEACRVIMLTTFDLDEYVYPALRAGVSGFLLQGRVARAAHRVRLRGRACAAWRRAYTSPPMPSLPT